MTLINFFSAATYLKGATTREKVQTFVLPLIFLILLYNSPSGLVIYWIFNNLFSLAKNIVKNQKNPTKILYILILIILASFAALFWIFKPNARFSKKFFLTLFVVFVAILPKFVLYCKKIFQTKRFSLPKANFPLFLGSAVGMAVLCGLVLPSSTIVSDPIAFSFLGNTESPLSYIKTSFFIYTGFFLVWPLLIYKLFDARVRCVETIVTTVLFLISLLNSFVFKFDYGTINILFNIEEDILQESYPILNMLSFASFVLIFALLILFEKNKVKGVVSSVIFILCIAEIALSANDIRKISTEFATYKANIANKTKDNLDSEIEPVYHLSREKQNVLVIFIDKAVGAFFPIVQKEHPELAAKFMGFTFYPNTASFGSATLYGSPAMLGGYDYTPENSNKRTDVLLRQKHNEATLTMPLLFMKSGFDVTVTDPPLPNFTEAGDLSAFSDYPSIKASELKHVYTARYQAEVSADTAFDEICRKGMVNFSILQILVPGLRNTFFRVMKNMDSDADDFFASFPSLYYLRNLTAFDGTKGTFTFIGNETPHFATFLNPNNFTEVSFDKDTSSRILDTDDDELIMNYHVFTASIKQLSLWLDYLKENDCYENTRIIITSDHGTALNIPNEFNDEKKFSNKQVLSFNPLLLVKDFGADGELKIDHEFMTNADTLFIASKGIIQNLENPFLHTPLIPKKQNGIRCFHTAKGEHNPMPIRTNKLLHLNRGIFMPTDLYHVEEWEELQN